MQKGFVPIIVISLVIVLIAGLMLPLPYYQSCGKLEDCPVGWKLTEPLLQKIIKPTIKITNFEECAKGGNPVTKSYPGRCSTPDGRHFVQQLSDEEKKKLIPPVSQNTNSVFKTSEECEVQTGNKCHLEMCQVSEGSTPDPVCKPGWYQDKSISDETASWKTYTNAKYGVTFKYDEGSELQESNQNNQLIVRLVNKKLDFNRNYKDSKPYQLAADNENFFTLEVVTNKIVADSLGRGCSEFDKSNRIMVGDYEGYSSEGTTVQGGVKGYTKSICLEKGYFIYEFFTQYLANSPEETKKTVIQLFNQTLITFKFLK